MHLTRTLRAAFATVFLGAVTACASNGGGAPPLQSLQQQRPLVAASVRTAATMRGRHRSYVPGPAGFSAIRVELGHNVIADDGFVVANFAKHYGISTIFLHVSGDDIGLLAARDPQTVANMSAMFAVANVYVLTGDVSWLASPNTVPKDVTAIVRTIAPLYPQLAGILYDIEPVPTQEAAYFQLLDTLLGGAQPYAFGTTILETDPTWWRHPNRSGGPTPSMLQEAEAYPAVTQTYLKMNGKSAAIQMTHDVTKSLAQMTKPYWSGADAWTQQGDSYIGVSANYLASNLEQVAVDVSAIDPQLAGVSVDDWNDVYGALELTLPQPTPIPIPQPSAPLVPPVGQSYVGAYVNPNKSGEGPSAVATFEASIGRKLAYDLHYRTFRVPLSGRDTADDIANGRVPMVAWDCATSDARIAAGAEDAQIRTAAAGAAAFGHPMFLRFLWEMNMPVQGPRKPCWDPATDLPNFRLSPTHYIAAYRHIHELFVAAGATNVIWVWNENGGSPNPAEYYPGNDVVDWVGIDHYDYTGTGFLANFAPFLDSTAQYDKPIVICETGTQSRYQAAYLPDLVASLAANYPLVKAVSYFDSGSVIDRGNWTLAGSGLPAFATMAQQPYFSAYPQI